jgi:hypothetical protein
MQVILLVNSIWVKNMKKIWRSIALIVSVLIISLMGCAYAQSGVEMRPGEATAEQLYNYGIGEAWVGGNPPSDSIYSQYYSIYQGSTPKKHIEAPKKSDIKNKAPATVYFSYQMQPMPYTQYQTYATYTGGNSLWIQGSSSWTQYAKVPQGSSLSLMATSSTGGNGYLYEINPDGKLYKNAFYFYPGYNQIDFYADSVGQHILLFVIGSQVSNSVVIDVTSYYPPPTYQQPVPTYPPTQTPPTQTPPTQAPPAQTPPPVTTPPSTYGDTPVTIVSQGMRGYQVFLDGTYIGTEGSGGDALDGRFSFSVVGNQNHTVRVYDGQFNYIKTMYFEKGVQKIINVEPGTAVYY